MTKPGRLLVIGVVAALGSAGTLCRAQAPAGEGWRVIEAPARVVPGGIFHLQVRVRNGSQRTWDAAGDRRITVGCVLVDTNGSPMPDSPPPLRLAYPVPANALGSTLPLLVTAPSTPGNYALLFTAQRREKGIWTAEDGPPLRWEFSVVYPKPDAKKPGP